MLRRIAFVTTAFYAENETFQLLVIYYMNIFMLIYIGRTKPLEILVRNKIELFNEGCICASCIFLTSFTDWVPDAEGRYYAGWGMCSIIAVNILVNGYFIIKLAFYKFWLLFKKCMIWYEYKFPKANEKEVVLN